MALKTKIVLISGLGANELAFSRIGDLTYPKVFAKWLTSQEDETLENYCQRFIEAYKIKSGDILIGLSFGGLIAQKIAELNGNKLVTVSYTHLTLPTTPYV